MSIRRRLTVLATAAVLTLTALVGVPTPAFAACGDTSNSWVPLTGSTWNMELFLNGSLDYTAQAVFTYTGQIAVTAIDDTLQVLTGNWDFEGGTTFAWSATDIADNTYRLTLRGTATDCGGLGGVHEAYGVVIHQTMGQIGTLFMARIV